MSTPTPIPKPNILIIGAGAVGLTQGHHLSPTATITYLVRPGRTPAFQPPKHLYSYTSDTLSSFPSYRVIESLAAVSGEVFNCIFDTLDGATAWSENGVATLQAVGKLVRAEQNAGCFVVYAAIGLDMDAHYARTMGIPTSRLLLAASILAHQPTPAISIPESADRETVERADVLFRVNGTDMGLLVFNTQPGLTKKLEAIYNASGKVKIWCIPGFATSWAMLLGILHLVAWNIDGFCAFPLFRRNKELWDLMTRAQSEILNLPRFGWMGWLLSFVLGSLAAEKLNLSLVEGAKPLRYEEFNAFHHGGKVAEQDLRVLEDVLVEGEGVGRKMEALGEVVRRARRIHT